MKKIKIRTKARSSVRIRVKDRQRAHKLSSSLIAASMRKRRKELEKSGNAPAKKQKRINITVLPSAEKKEDKPKTTYKISLPLNSSGNLRGMHNAENTDQMRKIRAMRGIYNKQMPVPACNSCSYSQQCPKFKAGFECAFLPMLNSHKVETVDDLMYYMQDLVASNFRRAQLATAMETLSGGAPSLELSESLMMLFQMTRDLAEFKTEQEKENGSLNIETDDSSVVNRLFGGMDQLLGRTKTALNNPLDVTPLGSADEEQHIKLGDGFGGMESEVDQEVMGDFDKTELAKMNKAAKDKKKQTGKGTGTGSILQSLLKKT